MQTQPSTADARSRIRTLILIVGSLCFSVPCHAQAEWVARGTPLSVTPLARMDPAQVSDYLGQFELASEHARYGVDCYRVVYQTIDATGAPTSASSLLAVPRHKHRELHLAAWLHGTLVYKGDAGSVNEDSEDRAAAVLFAAAGFVTTAPDYLGLGVGPGPHPYDDRASEVSASIDALLATRTLAEWLGERVHPQVAVSGFSQGGAASLALARALQDGLAPQLRLGMLAPIAGPYDMSATLAAAVRGDVAQGAAYVAYLSVAWNRLHYLYESPSDAFLAPYDETIEALFDNTHTAEQVLGALPSSLDALFTEPFLALLAEPRGPLRDALAVSDRVCQFAPEVVTHLYAASGDLDVPIANAYGCAASIEDHGGQVELIDFGAVDHYATLVRALPLALQRAVEALSEPGVSNQNSP
jgi:acetyl esterase/lipase